VSRRRALGIPVLLGVVLVVAGCSGAGSGAYGSGGTQASTPATSQAAASSPVTAIPAGKYHNPITPSGPQTLTVGPGATYSLTTTATGQAATGTLTQDAAQHVTFTSAAGTPCAGVPGEYRATTNGSALQLTAVKDSCPARATDLGSGPWVP
jgi:hypothetical protein